MIDKIYGYTLGQLVITTRDLTTENGDNVPRGTLIRLVAFAPKVIKISPHRSDDLDNKAYFFNAVHARQVADTGNRIRANFRCISQRPYRNKSYKIRTMKDLAENDMREAGPQLYAALQFLLDNPDHHKRAIRQAQEALSKARPINL